MRPAPARPFVAAPLQPRDKLRSPIDVREGVRELPDRLVEGIPLVPKFGTETAAGAIITGMAGMSRTCSGEHPVERRTRHVRARQYENQFRVGDRHRVKGRFHHTHMCCSLEASLQCVGVCCSFTASNPCWTLVAHKVLKRSSLNP